MLNFGRKSSAEHVQPMEPVDISRSMDEEFQAQIATCLQMLSEGDFAITLQSDEASGKFREGTRWKNAAGCYVNS